MRARLIALLLLALPVLSFPQYKPWYQFFNFAYGAKARSMGNAFTAVADDLTAAFWNPAGLAGLRTPEFYLGYKTSAQDHDYELQDKQIGGDTRLYNYNFDSRLNQIDFFAISAPFTALRRPCAFALGYYRYIPYGFKGTAKEVVTFLHDQYNPLRTTVTFAGSEGFDVLAFSLAAAATRHFALGATLQQFFGSGSMHLQTVMRESESHRQLTERVRGRNVIVGALFTPFRFLRLGFSWHSGLKSRFDSELLTWNVNKKGEKFNEKQDRCQARVLIPQQAALGLLLRPSRWLDVSADYSRIDWQDGTIAAYYGSDLLPYPQLDDWRPGQKQVRNLRFGAEARAPVKSWLLRLRCGWSLDRQLYADRFDAAVRVDGYSAGLGCEFSSNLLVEATYQRQKADFIERGYFGIRTDVSTFFRSNVFFLALTYRFGHIFKE